MALNKNNDAVARRTSRATTLLSYVAGAGCGISLLGMGVLITVITGETLAGMLDSPGSNRADFLGQLLGGVAFGCLFGLWSGVACGRFLLRALPPVVSEQRSAGQLWVIALCTAMMIAIYLISALFVVSLLLVAPSLKASNPDQVADLFAEQIFGAIPVAMLWTTGAVGLLIRRHRKPRAFLGRPFVLFLRRFSSFSDRTIVSLILRQASSRVPVVFFTPRRSRPRDWDPFLVGFSGLKLLHPWRSAPIVICVPDADWTGAAHELVCQARTILLDVSETTDSLRTESEMIERAGRWPDSVCLRLKAFAAPTGSVPTGSFGDVRTIEYTKSWMRALPRMLMGFLVVLFAAVVLFSAVMVLLPMGFAIFIADVGVLGAAVTFYYSAFVRPAVNRRAKIALRSLLRTGHATG
jgi:hypothetical protein